MPTRDIKRSFSGGEVTLTMPSRDDLSQYINSCIQVRNFTVHPHGSARYRQGFRYLVDAIGKCVFIPFEFNTEEEDMYVLVFSDLVINIIQDDGYVVGVGDITSPYLEDEVIDIKFAQLGDVVYLTHVNHAPRKISRTGPTTWVLEVVDFVSSINPPTSPAAVFTGTPGSAFTQNYKVTALTTKGEQSVGSVVFGAAAKPRSEWVTGDYMTLSWAAVPDAEEYYIYKEYGGFYGITGISDTTSFRDDNFIPEDETTPPIDNNPFTGGNNPGAVSFHEQRLWYGGSNLNPNTFYGSNTGGFENFTKSRPLIPDDSVSWDIASNIDQIKWITSFIYLLIGTAGAEHVLKGVDGGSISANNPLLAVQSYWGSSGISPIVVGSSLLHVQRQKSYVRDLSYSQEQQGYSGSDLTVLAEHLFEGHTITAWAYQRVPDSIIWAIRDDGVLLGMTYLKEYGVWGWHRHDTDGLFEHITVIGGDTEDRVYVSINQEGTRRIARLSTKWTKADGLANAFFVDLGTTYTGAPTTEVSGLDHLNGKEVHILADGNPIVDKTVVDGSITIDTAASVITVGLPYVGILSPLPFETEIQEKGTTQGEIRSFGNVKLRLLNTVGGSTAIGDIDSDAEELNYDKIEYTQENWSEAIPLYTGVKNTNPEGGGADKTIFVKQDRPLPMTVLAITSEVDYE